MDTLAGIVGIAYLLAFALAVYDSFRLLRRRSFSKLPPSWREDRERAREPIAKKVPSRSRVRRMGRGKRMTHRFQHTLRYTEVAPARFKSRN